jgi:hypothetical protein
MANKAMHQGLQALYVALDADVAAAGPICQLSGRCCRFKEYGHTLFISRPEAEVLLAEGIPANATIDAATCPFQIDGLCTARDRRPLGCRVYYCDARYSGTGAALSERYIKRLKELHAETDVPWEYRSLHDSLLERK